MSLHKTKAEEVLDLCLADESPKMREKVHEIIALSGLQPDDPMFLVFALTGQMRVFLEDVPQEMRESLEDWKNQNSQAIAEIAKAINQTRKLQEEQNNKIVSSVRLVNEETEVNIRAVHQQFINEIVVSNEKQVKQVKLALVDILEIQQQLRDIKLELDREVALRDREKADNIKIVKALIEGLSKTNRDLETVRSQIETSINILSQISTTSLLTKGLILTSSIVLLLFACLMFFGWKTQTTESRQTAENFLADIPHSGLKSSR